MRVISKSGQNPNKVMSSPPREIDSTKISVNEVLHPISNEIELKEENDDYNFDQVQRSKSGVTIKIKESTAHFDSKYGDDFKDSINSTNKNNQSYRGELINKVDSMYNSIFNNRSGHKFISWYKQNSAYNSNESSDNLKCIPRPSSVMTSKKNMESTHDIKVMREYTRKRQERCIKDLLNFEKYIKKKLIRSN